MFERFTDRIRRVVAKANMVALRQGCGFIDAEHVLVAMMEDGEGLGARVLQRLGVGRREIEDVIGLGGTREIAMRTVRPLPQTKRFRVAIEGALETAEEMGDQHVGTEHLVLGLMRVKDGGVEEVFARRGVRREQVVAEVARQVGRAEMESDEG